MCDLFRSLDDTEANLQTLLVNFTSEEEQRIDLLLEITTRDNATLRGTHSRPQPDKRTLLIDRLLQKRWDLFLTHWREQNLEERLTKACRYRRELDKELGVLINGNLHTGLPHPITDAVELFSISQPRSGDIRDITTVLTRSNGEIVTLVPPNISKDRSDVFSGSDLIKHDLRGHAHREDDSSLPLINRIPNISAKVCTALHFLEADDRQAEVDVAHHKTFHWLFKRGGTGSFIEWLRRGRGCYWINGKPGSGKSTLMKFISNHPSFIPLLEHWADNSQLVVCKFFFWSAGTTLQKSQEGLLRTLLSQIIEKRPSLTPVLFPHLLHRFLLAENIRHELITKTELHEALARFKTHAPDDFAVFLLVDGIDEYSGDHFEFCKFLMRLTERSTFKILASSRPLPDCHQVFARCPSIRLQDLTIPDIRAYIDEELMNDPLFIDMDQLETGFANDVRAALIEKACGVFLWIVLVVKRLLRGLGNYDDRSILMARIDELPNDLEKLYDHLFKQLSHEYQKEASQLIQYVVHARNIQEVSLTALQLLASMESLGIDDIGPDAYCYGKAQEELRIKRMDGKLRSRTCGLIEVRYTGPRGGFLHPKVEFLHRTVFDYLQDVKVWNRVLALNRISNSQNYRALLHGLVHVFHRRMLCWTNRERGTFSQQNIGPLFRDCLEYCYQLSCHGSALYTKYLMSTNQALVDTDHWCYGSVWHEDLLKSCRAFEENHNLIPQAAEVLENVKSPQLLSTLQLASWGFPEHLEELVKTVSAGTKSVILNHLLHLASPWSNLGGSKQRMYLRNIEVLLKNGTNPNDDLTVVEQSNGISDSNPLSSWHEFSAWTSWIAVDTDAHWASPITLSLLEAGASPCGRVIGTVVALKDYRTRLRDRRDEVPENEQAVIDEILERTTPKQMHKREISHELSVDFRPDKKAKPCFIHDNPDVTNHLHQDIDPA